MPKRGEDPDYIPEEEMEGDGNTEEVRIAKKRKTEAEPNTQANVAIEGIAEPPIRIAAFNIQIFGEKKMDNQEIAKVLVEILQRYDLILIQEIRDSSETALDELVADLNKVDPSHPFGSIVSGRLGRTHSKEQYGFLYRKNLITVVDKYQFDDGRDDGTDMFQREPFAVRFQCPTTEVKDFAIIAIHTEPDRAVEEIGSLHKVYEATKAHWDLEDILIAGDLNADEGYVNQDDWSKIPLRSDKKFKWLIGDSIDTTTGNTDRAYDRFIAVGGRLTAGIVKGSATVFKFDKAFGLNEEEVSEVSDHYPIEMKLKGKINHQLQDNVGTSVIAVIEQKTPAEKESNVRKVYRAEEGAESANFVSTVIYDDSRMTDVEATRENVPKDQVVSSLEEFSEAFPGVLYPGTIQMAKAHLGASYLTDGPYVYGLDETNASQGTFTVMVKARLQDPLTVSVHISRRMS